MDQRYVMVSYVTLRYVRVENTHTSTQNTADANATYRCCQWARLRFRPLSYDDAVCERCRIEISVLDA